MKSIHRILITNQYRTIVQSRSGWGFSSHEIKEREGIHVNLTSFLVHLALSFHSWGSQVFYTSILTRVLSMIINFINRYHSKYYCLFKKKIE